MAIPGRVVLCVGIILGLCSVGSAQQSRSPMNGGMGQTGQGRGGVQQNPMPQNPMPQNPSAVPGIMESDAPMNPRMEEQQAKMRNLDRQKQIVADTQKLVDLANQLKSDVDKSNKDTLSLDVIRKADEIEKLAKQVKDKMKGS